MWTLLIIALVQMPNLALTPGINQIATSVFPSKSLGDIQEAMALTSFIGPVIALISAVLINRGVVSKRATVIAGLFLLAVNGFAALFFHTEFWHLHLLNVLLGLSTGLFLSNSMGVMFDHFDNDECEKLSGYQTACINGGGILFSLAGGALGAMMWYGGYLVLLAGLPVAILSLFTIPKDKPQTRTAEGKKQKTPLNPRVYYYSAVIGIFMMIYGVGGSNISTHMAAHGIGSTATAGIAVAVQMGGGVLSGIFFGKLSEKFGDMILVIGCVTIFVGFMLLSLFPASLFISFLGIFISGLSMSCMMPRCLFSVSTLVDPSNSATATAISSSICPSLGGFLSPYVFTRITTWLYGDSTVMRYRFAAFVVLAFAVFIALVTLSRKKREIVN
jgi:MFS family permease